MVSSQDAAIAVALTELGYDVQPAVEVFSVTKDAPADGKLQVRDVIVAVNGSPTSTTEEVGNAVRSTPKGQDVTLTVVRDGEERDVTITPGERDGAPFIGIDMLPGYRFPFDVSVDIDPKHRRAERRADVLARRSTTS